MRTRRWLVIVLVVGAALAGADGARAAAVSVSQEPTIVNLDFAAAPGEVNEVTITSGADRVVTVQDVSASLTAGAGCAAVDTHTVTCPPGSTRFTAVHADLGDMDDAIFLPTGTAAELVDVTAGTGNDRVSNRSAEPRVAPRRSRRRRRQRRDHEPGLPVRRAG